MPSRQSGLTLRNTRKACQSERASIDGARNLARKPLPRKPLAAMEWKGNFSSCKSLFSMPVLVPSQ